MTDKLRNAIAYTQTLITEENYDCVFIGQDSSNLLSKGPDGNGVHDTVYKVNAHNPIQAIIDNVLTEMCTDCLKDDYMFKYPYFTSLVRAYIEVLINQYGNVVPITRTLAHRIVTDKLSEHKVFVRNGDVKNRVREWSDDYDKNNFSFTLEVVKE